MSRRHNEEYNRVRHGRPCSRNQRYEGESWPRRNQEDNSRYQERERSPRYSHRNQQDYNEERSNFYTPNRRSRPQNLDNRGPFDLDEDDEDDTSPYSEYLHHRRNRQDNRNSRSERQHSYGDSPNYNRFNEENNTSFQAGGGDRNYYNPARQRMSLPNWSQAPMLEPHYLEALHPVVGSATPPQEHSPFAVPPQEHSPFAGPPQEYFPFAGPPPGYSPFVGQLPENSPFVGRPQEYSPFAGHRFSNTTCFNCARKGHSIMGCPYPRNKYMVQFNRFRFNQQRGSLRNAKRYHETDLRELQPGNISDVLRKSLGLEDNQLPKFIYKMRTFGYPTAWLREAAIVPSRMTIIGTQKSEESTDSNNVRYNIDKLISFPGYNAPAPPDTIDESELHDAPAYNKDQDLSIMIEVIQEASNSKEQSSSSEDYSEGEGSNNLLDKVSQDEGSKEFSEKVSQDKGIKPFLDKVSHDEISSNEGKKPFGEGFKDVKVSEVGSERDLKCLGGGSKDFQLVRKCRSKNEERSKTANDEVLGSPNDSTYETSGLNKVGDSVINQKKASLGPVINPLSPFKQLPPMVNFAKGVSDVVAFENLPDAVGTFQNMKSILQKVKTTVKKKT